MRKRSKYSVKPEPRMSFKVLFTEKETPAGYYLKVRSEQGKTVRGYFQSGLVSFFVDRNGTRMIDMPKWLAIQNNLLSPLKSKSRELPVGFRYEVSI